MMRSDQVMIQLTAWDSLLHKYPDFDTVIGSKWSKNRKVRES